MSQTPNYKFSISIGEVVVRNKPGWDYGEQIRRGFNPADNDCEWITFARYKLNSRSDMFKFQTFLQRIGNQDVYLENSSVKPTIEKALNTLGLMFNPIKIEKLNETDKNNENKKTICYWAMILSCIALIANPDAGLMLFFLSFILSSILVSKQFLWGILVIFMLIAAGV